MVAGALALGAALPASAQEIPAATKPNAQRAPLPVPKTPDLTMAPLPASPPDQPEVSPAPAYTLPPPRLPVSAVAPDPAVALPARVAGGSLTLLFSAGVETLADPMLAPLADVATRLKAHPAERLDVRAYATGPADRASDARRTALLRARAVRDRLVAAGIDPLRLNIFAEGVLIPVPTAGQPLPVPDPKAPPPDRVDLVFRP
jgi:outer membrane protein OmpA-like peptidoglycan-associated protein